MSNLKIEFNFQIGHYWHDPLITSRFNQPNFLWWSRITKNHMAIKIGRISWIWNYYDTFKLKIISWQRSVCTSSSSIVIHGSSLIIFWTSSIFSAVVSVTRLPDRCSYSISSRPLQNHWAHLTTVRKEGASMPKIFVVHCKRKQKREVWRVDL